MGKRPCTLPTSSCLSSASSKSKNRKKSMKDVEFLPCSRRKDAVLARSCPNASLNLKQCRAAAGSKPLSRTQIAVAGMRDEHLVSSFVVGSVVVKNDI